MNKSFQKLLLEFIPFIFFLLTYKNANILYAAGVMGVVTVICSVISYVIDGKVSNMLLISGILLITTASISIFTGDSRYFKMKPTIVYLIFAAILWIGAKFNKYFIQDNLKALFILENHHWNILTKRFTLFLVVLAILNEIVWRNFSESFWVNFKVFGAVPITIIFMSLQLPFLKKHNQKQLP